MDSVFVNDATRRGAPARSMTGFAGVRRQTPAGELTITLRSVNHRGLDLHFHQIGLFAAFENQMRALLKEQIRRGHIEVRVFLTAPTRNGAAAYNSSALERYLSAFRAAAEQFQLRGEPDLNALFALPGIFEPASLQETIDAVPEADLLGALSECVAELNAYREREGNELRVMLQREAGLIENATAKIRELRARLVSELHARLRERIAELLNGSGVPEARIAEEAAVLADRSDIEEELTRLTVHTAELKRILDEGGEIGKRLDFLLQEMNREANTTLSKSSGAGEPALQITNLGLAIKANIEKIREQSLNLE